MTDLVDLQHAQRLLAAALLRRAVFDLTSRSRHAPEVWDWFFGPPAPDGWDFEETARLLELSVPHLRRALQRAGYATPPAPVIGGSREKIPGIIPCRRCGIATPAVDVRVQRTCPACGDRLSIRYLRRRGLVPASTRTRLAPVAHAAAALRHLLEHGPLPTAYVDGQLARSGLAWRTVRRARRQLRVRASRHGYQGAWLVAL